MESLKCVDETVGIEMRSSVIRLFDKALIHHGLATHRILPKPIDMKESKAPHSEVRDTSNEELINQRQSRLLRDEKTLLLIGLCFAHFEPRIAHW